MKDQTQTPPPSRGPEPESARDRMLVDLEAAVEVLRTQPPTRVTFLHAQSLLSSAQRTGFVARLRMAHHREPVTFFPSRIPHPDGPVRPSTSLQEA